GVPLPGAASGGLCCSCSRRATSVAAGPCPAAARGAPRMDGVREVLSSAALENHGDHWIEGMSMRPACASSATGGSFRSPDEIPTSSWETKLHLASERSSSVPSSVGPSCWAELDVVRGAARRLHLAPAPWAAHR
ncbi:unnamed protein product, partial [Durusdinium trenchii]